MASPDPEFSAEVVARQTDYDLATARDKLAAHDGDIVATIREFHGHDVASLQGPDGGKTTNQRIYGEIRGLMDGAAAEHRRISAEEQEKQRKLDAFTKNARMLAAITTPPADLIPDPRPVGPMIARCQPATDSVPTAFLLLDELPATALQHPWLLRIREAEALTSRPEEARAAGAKGLMIDSDGDPPAVSTLSSLKDTWSDGCMCIRVKPNGPASLTKPVGDRELTPLEGGRVLRARTGGKELSVVSDEDFDRYLSTVRELEEAGASLSVTDPLYDIGTFMRFLVGTRRAGIKMPVCPCVKPITAVTAFENDAERLNTRVPPGVEAAVHKLTGTEEGTAVRAYGLALARTALKALALRGAQVCLIEAEDDAVVTETASFLMPGSVQPAPESAPS